MNITWEVFGHVYNVNQSTKKAGHDCRSVGVLTFSMYKVTLSSKRYETTFSVWVYSDATDRFISHRQCIFDNKKLKHSSIITGS